MPRSQRTRPPPSSHGAKHRGARRRREILSRSAASSVVAKPTSYASREVKRELPARSTPCDVD
eukprot:3054451-Prymnesium_polylepis.1